MDFGIRYSQFPRTCGGGWANHRDGKLLKPQRCPNCIYSVRVAGHSDSVLVCTNKAGSAGKLTLAEKEGSCRNFQKKRIVHRPNPPQPDDEEIRFIPLTKGKFAIVDAADYNWLSRYKWHAVRSGDRFYAYRSKNKRCLSMHRVITGAPKGKVVDHRDGNSLNNRRSNLRVCKISENLYNCRGRNMTSKYKGVHWDKQHKKWVAAITDRGKYKFIGHFDRESEAARAYDRKAAELFGEFAYLNFPDSATEIF